MHILGLGSATGRLQLTALQKEALELVEEVAGSPELRLDYKVEPGMQQNDFVCDLIFQMVTAACAHRMGCAEQMPRLPLFPVPPLASVVASAQWLRPLRLVPCSLQPVFAPERLALPCWACQYRVILWMAQATSS